MSLVGTLAKIALAVAAAKGIGNVDARARQPAPTDVPSTQSQDPLSSILGGKSSTAGGLGSLLEQLATSVTSAGSASGAKASGGGLDALIKGLADAASGAGAAAMAPTGNAQSKGSFSDALNQSFQNWGEPKVSPTPQQESAAGLMLRAMLQAAKSDGKIDEGEKSKIRKALGDASPEDMAFVERELSAPVDVNGLAKQVPKGLESQIYAVSVMGIDLDSQAEAEYLAQLSRALGLAPNDTNAIHAKLGIPALFS